MQWIHLDLKGMIPSQSRLLEWLQWLRDCGFRGVVLEYEDRLPWQTWPGTFRPGYELDAWNEIWRHCDRLGLEVMPLVQTFGHLEWLLKHNDYAHLREANHLNLVCPNHPDVLPRMRHWLDEVVQLHPDSRYLHIGLDEVRNLATCPICAAAASEAADGPFTIYLRYAAQICDHVLSHGRTPVLWADMFLEHGLLRSKLMSQLPDGVLLCDWRYREHDAPVPVAGASHHLMGASAIRCGFDPPHELATDLNPRLANIREWHHRANTSRDRWAGIIHTTWGRSRSLSPLYGPWEGWLPGFIAAGTPNATLSDAMTKAMPCLARGLNTRSLSQIREASEAIGAISSDDPFEQQALRWWNLALRHRGALWWAEGPLTMGYAAQCATARHVGVDPELRAVRRAEYDSTRQTLLGLADEIRSFGEDNQWSDIPEFINSRIDNVVECLDAAWG